MFLVLCGDDDPSAFWAADGLRDRGLSPLTVVTSSALAAPRRWEHLLSAGGVPELRIELSDRTVLRSNQVLATLNRLRNVPPPWTAREIASDREYAESELFALFLSGLAALPGPMINRPTASFLGGPSFTTAGWLMRARNAGLNIPTYRGNEFAHRLLSELPAPLRTVYTIGARVLTVDGDEIPEAVRAGCRRLASQVGATLLAMTFNQEWVLAGASAVPDLRAGGQALLDCLAESLSSRVQIGPRG